MRAEADGAHLEVHANGRLLGGVASGKSLVARQFAELGPWLDADRAGHEVLLDPPSGAKQSAHLGTDVFGQTDSIDRRPLGQIVFGPGEADSRELAFFGSSSRIREFGSMLEKQASDASGRGYRSWQFWMPRCC